ncbi:MAG TPA: hypothetical protein VLL52_10640 [Anaerolineae bacterium]|nr:hypothetical protein [Anaerolineae bacterium]
MPTRFTAISFLEKHGPEAKLLQRKLLVEIVGLHYHLNRLKENARSDIELRLEEILVSLHDAYQLVNFPWDQYAKFVKELKNTPNWSGSFWWLDGELLKRVLAKRDALKQDIKDIEASKKQLKLVKDELYNLFPFPAERLYEDVIIANRRLDELNKKISMLKASELELEPEIMQTFIDCCEQTDRLIIILDKPRQVPVEEAMRWELVIFDMHMKIRRVRVVVDDIVKDNRAFQEEVEAQEQQLKLLNNEAAITKIDDRFDRFWRIVKQQHEDARDMHRQQEFKKAQNILEKVAKPLLDFGEDLIELAIKIELADWLQYRLPDQNNYDLQMRLYQLCDDFLTLSLKKMNITPTYLENQIDQMVERLEQIEERFAGLKQQYEKEKELMMVQFQASVKQLQVAWAEISIIMQFNAVEPLQVEYNRLIRSSHMIAHKPIEEDKFCREVELFCAKIAREYQLLKKRRAEIKGYLVAVGDEVGDEGLYEWACLEALSANIKESRKQIHKLWNQVYQTGVLLTLYQLFDEIESKYEQFQKDEKALKIQTNQLNHLAEAIEHSVKLIKMDSDIAEEKKARILELVNMYLQQARTATTFDFALGRLQNVERFLTGFTAR